MRSPISVLSLPASLLLLISSSPAHTSTHDRQWPYNLPPHMKYFPEDEPIIRRDLEIQLRLAYQFPAGVQKMSGDEGEKFYMTYWHFESEETEDEGKGILTPLRTRAEHLRNKEVWGNASISLPFQPPYLLHTNDDQTSLNPHPRRVLRFPRAVLPSLDKRAFQCPTGTSNCASISRPNSCCATGETCQLITDTGLGDVGCCGQGQTCSGQVTTCDAGYTSCPNNPGGGCCIPGYSCVDVGCARSSTETVIITPTVTASPPSSTSSTSTSSTSTSTSASTSTSSPPPSSSLSPSTSSLVVVPIPSPSASVKPQSSLTCSNGFNSCPASLGGGCCPTGRACGATECPPTSSTSSDSNTFIQASPSTTSTNGNPAAPVRPTSIASPATTTDTTETMTGTMTGTNCPTGFYQCSAYYTGGCCRVGRDCGVTSCPTQAVVTSVLGSGGPVVVVPTGVLTNGASTSTGTEATLTTTIGTVTTSGSGSGGGGSCAQGWYSCPANNGGGCCPSGYVCGASCTASVSGGGSVGKIAAGGASPRKEGMGLLGTLLVGVAMVLMGVGVGM